MPRFLANMWLSLNEQKYSPGYTAQHLRALDMLYTYFENSSAELKNLNVPRKGRLRVTESSRIPKFWYAGYFNVGFE